MLHNQIVADKAFDLSVPAFFSSWSIWFKIAFVWFSTLSPGAERATVQLSKRFHYE